MKNLNTNTVKLAGQIISNFEFDYSYNDIKFYRTEIAVKRYSGTIDYIPVTVPEKLIHIDQDYICKYVFIEGKYVSYNITNNGKTSLKLVVKVNYIEEIDNTENDENIIILNGYICKEPNHRVTPLGKEITDVILAVNSGMKSSYIPCIFWHDRAKTVGELSVGTHMEIVGRIQSREYIKKISETEQETHIAYEVSVHNMKVIL